VFERLRDALRAALDAATPPGDLRDLARQMREAVVEAKLAVGETREAVARCERDLTQERQRLADAERRGRLAGEIQDRETVEVAQRFAAKHRERVEVLEKKLAALRDELVAGVLASVPDAVLSGDPADRLPGNAHFTFPGCEGDSLLMLLDAKGIECSTGSACTAGVAQPSHVLLAMGVEPAAARGSLRFSLGHTSTAEDVAALAEAIGPAVERARNAGIAGMRRRSASTVRM